MTNMTFKIKWKSSALGYKELDILIHNSVEHKSYFIDY